MSASYMFITLVTSTAPDGTERSLERKLLRFGDEMGVEVVFEQIAVTEAQVRGWRLPTREPKRKSAADKRWEYDFACELDAIAPDDLRDLVERAINLHLSREQLAIMQVAEESERELLRMWNRKEKRNQTR
jgi:hypothetical protein